MLVMGIDIYPNRPDLADRHYWKCDPCSAYVGCHGNGTRPLGELAGPELRKLRRRAHRLFDKLWDGKPAMMSRSTAYSNMQRWLMLSAHEAHIGKLNETYCMALINKCLQIGLKEDA